MSSPEDVSKAIDYAYRLATDEDPLFNIFYRYFSDNEGPIRTTDNPEDLHFRLQKYLFPQSNLNKLGLEDLQSSKVINALRTHTPIKKLSGDCAQPDPKHADASVSNHAPNAQICFSLGNLARLPRSVLVTEVLSLLMHEASHMGGAREQDAKTVQKLFADYVLTHFGELRLPKKNETVGLTHLNDLLDSATSALGEAIIIEDNHPGDPKTWEKFSLFLSALYSEQANFDPLKLEFDYPETEHENTYAYLNSIMALIEKAQNATGFTEFVDTDQMKVVPSPTFKDNQLADLLMELNENLQVVNINFLALIGSNYNSICVLPNKQIDPAVFSKGFHHSKGILLPRLCNGAKVPDGEKRPFPSREEFKKLIHAKTQTNLH